jgi:outer membrane protein TolC
VSAQGSRDPGSGEAHRRAVVVPKPRPSEGDALAERHKDREFRECQRQLAFWAQDRTQLSRGGVASYLEVLSNEANYLNAALGVAQAQSSELLALVEIYQNWGGGGQP